MYAPAVNSTIFSIIGLYENPCLIDFLLWLKVKYVIDFLTLNRRPIGQNNKYATTVKRN